MPIGRFGDLDAYASSPIRAITVGLNPSGIEFPTGNPAQRFPKATGMIRNSDLSDPEAYFAALNGYFKHDPYWRWFGAYECFLNGLSTSFRPTPGGANSFSNERFTAIHTDLLSPIATTPTWSRLPRDVQAALRQDGVPLWRKFVELLAPDVVIASMSRAYLAEIAPQSTEWHEVKSVHKKQVWRARAAQTRIGDHETILIHAPAQTLPFGPFTNDEKRQIGTLVSLAWRAPKLSHLLRGPSRHGHAVDWMDETLSPLDIVHAAMREGEDPSGPVDAVGDEVARQFFLAHGYDAELSYPVYRNVRPRLETPPSGMTARDMAWWLNENLGA
jgi:hypothetical protein